MAGDGWRDRWRAARGASPQRWLSFAVALLVRAGCGALAGLVMGWFLVVGGLTASRPVNRTARTAALKQFQPAWVTNAGKWGAGAGALLAIWTIPRWKCPWRLPDEF